MGLLIHLCLETPCCLPYRNKLKITWLCFVTWTLSFTRILVLIIIFIFFVLQHDSLQIMLERFRTFLQVSKNNIPPDYKEKLGSYEKFIVNYINTNRSKMPAPQQGQLCAPHMQSVLSLENQINLQLQSMNLQDNSMSQQGQLRAPHMQSVLSLENQINLQLHSMNLQDNSMSDWICLNAHKLAG